MIILERMFDCVAQIDEKAAEMILAKIIFRSNSKDHIQKLQTEPTS